MPHRRHSSQTLRSKLPRRRMARLSNYQTMMLLLKLQVWKIWRKWSVNIKSKLHWKTKKLRICKVRSNRSPLNSRINLQRSKISSLRCQRSLWRSRKNSKTRLQTLKLNWKLLEPWVMPIAPKLLLSTRRKSMSWLETTRSNLRKLKIRWISSRRNLTRWRQRQRTKRRSWMIFKDSSRKPRKQIQLWISN